VSFPRLIPAVSGQLSSTREGKAEAGQGLALADDSWTLIDNADIMFIIEEERA
jgi:hypothetical protein